jgi:RNA recognition motif-containing protein
MLNAPVTLHRIRQWLHAARDLFTHSRALRARGNARAEARPLEGSPRTVRSMPRGISMNIYVGNLAYEVTEDDLRTVFAPFGEVTAVTVIRDRFSGVSRGFGFVEMPAPAAAQAAIAGLHGQALKGRTLRVNEARPRGDRRGGGLASDDRRRAW